MQVRLLRLHTVSENIDAATCDIELLDPVNVSVVFGIVLLKLRYRDIPYVLPVMAAIFDLPLTRCRKVFTL